MDELITRTYNWAYNNGLLAVGNPDTQFKKIVEEVGELAAGMVRDNREDIADAIGDVIVTVLILSWQLNLDPERCLENVLDIIEKRTGRLHNGAFIKSEETTQA